VSEQRPIEVAVIGGGCGAIAAAFELTRPEHRGKYHVTVYQLGWRLGGKGASGRGPADRIEEHGFHVWLGFYENAFRLLRECYAELRRDPRQCRFADWRDAFSSESFIGVTDRTRGGAWLNWMAYFPPSEGLPGDPLTEQNPFSVGSYLTRTAILLRTLLLACQTRQSAGPDRPGKSEAGSPAFSHLDSENFWVPSPEPFAENIGRLLKYGFLATMAGLIEAVGILETVFRALSRYPENLILRLLDAIAANARRQLEAFAEGDDEIRRLWEVVDLVLAIMRGVIRFGLAADPRGFDAINEYECREWLRMNGASERSLNSALVRGLYDLAFAYEDGDFRKPRLAAGQALRGSLRMFFSSRGAIFWKMRAGMGDVVFAPFYEVLKKRGVSFKFFHRLENVKLVDPAGLAPGERPYVEALEFDVQAEVKGGREYHPLIDVRGLSCWPAKPDYEQLVDGDRYEREEWDFESHWDRRKVAVKTLRVVDDFDFVVLGVGIGVIPYACKEIVARDPRWRAMVDHVKTVATQAFQIWMCEDMGKLGWVDPPASLSAFVQPFDTWADMWQLIPEENWPTRPHAIAYFCCVLPDPPVPPDRSDATYPARRQEDVRGNAIRFLNRDVVHLWPNAVRRPGQFRWELLIDPTERRPNREAPESDESRFDSQFWRANVNPSDRYTLALPGGLKHRISPLDNTYDNLTIAGDWTDCGFNEGCVEAAVISGRLAAHAISHLPPLEHIIGYDHP
jgi:uncharacterized protein with NAD-binding domain and iron-sulfur cluster